MLKDELIKALEMDAQGDWDGAHKIVQKYYTFQACRIHAYLHRKEGDLGNADYWYSRASHTRPEISPENEWNELYKHLKNL
ncbi:MAG: hypothetical protein JW731_12310 [Bacteroidales bacterium]|nr:hypothetical protein [Bacteroidales bacterium]